VPQNFWKHILIISIFVITFTYMLPNTYDNDPIVQVSKKSSDSLDIAFQDVEDKALSSEISFNSLEKSDSSIVIRFKDEENQIRMREFLYQELDKDYTVALNTAPKIPAFLKSLGAKPMNLGLDLKGGVHFLMEVDLEEVVDVRFKKYKNDIRNQMRENNIFYNSINVEKNLISLTLKNNTDIDKASKIISETYTDSFDINLEQNTLNLTLKEEALKDIGKAAIKQNITTLRNRVNELGVAEPIVQQSGKNRVVVELPGIKDTARAKEIIGATATLEFKMVDEDYISESFADEYNIPINSKLYKDQNNNPIVLKRNVVLTGENIVDASSGFDQNSRPAVNITLDSLGAKTFSKITGKNIGKAMAVIFIENKPEIQTIGGIEKRVVNKSETVINVATIQEQLSKVFQITGLDSPKRSRDLALYLRAGSMAAPMYIIEERTIGPSLGKANIEMGQNSVIIGMLLVLLFMVIYYKVFGLFANLALIFNLIIIVGIMSMITGATLTLPGIAGIVLTVGMAVDANVLIYERIREEIRNGSTNLASITLGYKKAFSTIADANITTLIASIILFMFGTGPIKGFAVTLSIGILSSMFTSIIFTKVLADLIYARNIENKKIKLRV
jgi:preprotein translocase subunit SecD